MASPADNSGLRDNHTRRAEDFWRDLSKYSKANKAPPAGALFVLPRVQPRIHDSSDLKPVNRLVIREGRP